MLWAKNCIMEIESRRSQKIESFYSCDQQLCKFIRTKEFFLRKAETPTRLVWNTNMADMTSCHDGPSHLTKQEPIGFWMDLMIGRKTNRFLLINSGFVIRCEVPSQNQACLLRRKKSRSSLFANETRIARYLSRKNFHDIIVFECC